MSFLKGTLNLLAFAFVLALSAVPSSAAAAKPKAPTPGVVVTQDGPLPQDVASVDDLMRAFYEVVNVRPNEPRQWTRDRHLYVPWVRFISTHVDEAGRAHATVWNHQQYVEATEPLIAEGFREWEIARTTRVYGSIVHVESSYEGEVTSKGKVERFRGLNSIETYFDGQRWWISSVMWMSESPNHPLPKALATPQR